MIELRANAYYAYAGKQYIARITGRDDKFTFEREFIGRQESKGVSTVDVDTPGLYLECDLNRKGIKLEKFVLVLAYQDDIHKLYIEKEDAMAIAKRLDAREEIDSIVHIEKQIDGHLTHTILTKAQAKAAAVAVTVDSAAQRCWEILQVLPQREARKVLADLKLRVSPARIVDQEKEEEKV